MTCQDFIDSHNGKTLQIFPLIIVICNLGLCEIESLVCVLIIIIFIIEKTTIDPLEGPF
jgi:hypothetical protein